MQPKYDLEEKTFQYARDIRILMKRFTKHLGFNNDCDQLIKSSGSIGANYIEANEKLTKKDFIYRLKISRKEAKECIYWLKLIKVSHSDINEAEFDRLIREATELKKIFSSIILKCQG